MLRTPALWVLVAAAGATNAAFNWGVVIGDVVRVVLLFYLMPLWTVLLARLLLGERLTPAAMLRTVLALVGAAIVLWPETPGAGSTLPAAAAAGLARRLAGAGRRLLVRAQQRHAAARGGAARGGPGAGDVPRRRARRRHVAVVLAANGQVALAGTGGGRVALAGGRR